MKKLFLITALVSISYMYTAHGMEKSSMPEELRQQKRNLKAQKQQIVNQLNQAVTNQDTPLLVDAMHRGLSIDEALHKINGRNGEIDMQISMLRHMRNELQTVIDGTVHGSTLQQQALERIEKVKQQLEQLKRPNKG